MVQAVTGKHVGVETAVGLAPTKGPRSVVQTIDFSGVATPQKVMFTATQNAGKIEFVQSVYVDNSNNPAPLSVTCNLTFQTLTWPANSQGYQSILAPREVPDFTVATAGLVVVSLQFLSFMVPNSIWSTVSGGSLGADFSNAQPAVAANLIATIPASQARRTMGVQNQSAAQIQVWLDDATSNVGTGNNPTVILLEAAGANTGGGSWSSDSFKGRVRVYSGTANVQVAAYAH